MYFSFDRSIRVEWLETVKGLFGQDVETWTLLFSLKAHRKDTSKDRSSEKVVEDMVEVSSSYTEFVVRFNSGRRLVSDELKPRISTNMRIKDDFDVVWDVENVSEPPNTRRQYLVLRCKQRGER